MRSSVEDLNRASTLSELYDTTARAVRDLTGFDRVMVYRYDEDFNGEVVAETDAALTLREASYPAVQYIPLDDVVPGRLKCSDTATYCPFKGDASYYPLTTADGHTVEDAGWTYEAPYPAVAAIAGHLAFYPDKADVGVGS